MKLSEIKEILQNTETIAFQLPNGNLVPSHFHVTEIGKITKNFVDCGGTVRKEDIINFQLWNADDYDHRLHPEKLIQIIEIAQSALDIPDGEIEVEYQGETIEKYGLAYDGIHFLLTSKHTDCLAKDNCGIPTEKPKIKMVNLQNSGSCTPGSGCC